MMPTLTPEDLRSTYGFVFASGRDAQYQQLIAVAESMCLRCLDRKAFESAEFVQHFDGGSRDLFVLDAAPVLAVTSVCIDASRVFSNPLEPSAYSVDRGTGILALLVPGLLPKEGRKVMRVEYTAGWAAVPDDIKYCIAATVQYLAKLMQSNQVGITARNADGGTESLEQNLPPLAVQRHLSMYRFGRAR